MNKYTDIINSETPTLVDFHATWCGPCKAMSPLLDQLKKEKGSTLRILKIDVDKNQALAAQIGVRGVPTLLFYKAGQLLWRRSGLMPYQELLSMVN
jgi:thioredoxin 1